MSKWSGLITSMTALIISLAIGEYGLRLLAPVPDPYEEYKKIIYFNRYIKSEYPPHYQRVDEIAPGLPGVQGTVNFTMNNMGFRGDHLSLTKPETEFRIFMVGASSVEGRILDDSQSVTRIIQEELSLDVPIHVVPKVYGVAKSGDASDDNISMIVHRLVQMEPDMIIWLTGGTDLTSRSLANYDYLHYTMADAQGNQLSQFDSSGKMPLLKFLAFDFQITRRIYYFREKLYPRTTDVFKNLSPKDVYLKAVELDKARPLTDEKPPVNLTAYTNNLLTIIGVTQAHGIQLVLVTQATTWNSTVDPEARNWHWMRSSPSGVRYREDLLDEAMETLNDGMRQLAVKHSVSLYDLADLMPKSLEFFYDDVHFNVKGAQTAGEGIATFILEKNLIP